MSSRIMKLEDCVLLIIDCRGKTPQKLGSSWVNKGIRVISANNVHDGMLTDENEIRCVDDITYHKWMKESVQRGDCFLVSEGATLGESLYWDSDEKVVLGQRLYAIRTKKDILDSKYFSLYLRTSICRKFINAISTGSTVFGISQKDLLRLEIVVPDIFVQKKIGELKYEIDKKIQNNKIINAELESMAKTIYDYWFLQFDFPDENGKPYKSSGGKMVWNEELKREIPEGWEVKKIQDILTKISTTKKYKLDEYGKGNKYPIIDQSSKYICGYTDDENELLCLEDCIVFGDHTKCVKYVNFAFARGADGTQVINSSISNLPNYILYRQILDMDLVSQGYSRYFKFLKDKYVIAPQKNVSESFMEGIKGSLNKMKHIINENRELESLRDFLLPLLMNGQVGFKQ